MSRVDQKAGIGVPAPPRPAVVRRKFRAFAVLTVVAVATRLPIWSWLALLATTALIPVAVAAYGGPELLRTVFWPDRARRFTGPVGTRGAHPAGRGAGVHPRHRARTGDRG